MMRGSFTPLCEHLLHNIRNNHISNIKKVGGVMNLHGVFSWRWLRWAAQDDGVLSILIYI